MGTVRHLTVETDEGLTVWEVCAVGQYYEERVYLVFENGDRDLIRS